MNLTILRSVAVKMKTEDGFKIRIETQDTNITLDIADNSQIPHMVISNRNERGKRLSI